MRSEIIEAVNANLHKAVLLLEHLEAAEYIDTTIGPYYSSIGSHIRHVLDFYSCIIDGVDINNINLIARKREEIIATDKQVAVNKIFEIQQSLLTYKDVNTAYIVHVTDNLGAGEVTVDYTLDSILAHANSHAIHHFALIGYMLHQLQIEHTIPGFGYNPTTPIPTKSRS